MKFYAYLKKNREAEKTITKERNKEVKQLIKKQRQTVKYNKIEQQKN